MRSFTDLDAWKKSHQLRKDISELIESFPPEEKYRLIDHIICSSRSIGANIAEGNGRFHYVDSKKFFVTARQSASKRLIR